MASSDTGGTPPDGTASAAIKASAINGQAADGGEETAPGCGSEQTTPQVTILICSDCRPADGSDARPRPGELLAQAARQAAQAANTPDTICIQTVACLGNCKRRLSASLVTQGCWSYVFGDLEIENARDLIDAALLMQSSQDGLMPWRGRPQCMKKGLVARIPPLVSDPLSKLKTNTGD